MLKLLITIHLLSPLLGMNPLFAASAETKRIESLEQAVQTLSKEVKTLQKEREDLKLFAKQIIQQYPVNDQHDTLMMSLQDTLTDKMTNDIDLPSHQEHLQKLVEGHGNGSIPEHTVRTMELTVKLDQINDAALQYKTEAQRTKIASLEGLQNLDSKAFATGDRDTNLAQFRWFQKELEKAEATLDYLDTYYKNYHALYLNGAGTWAEDHLAEANLKKAQAAVDGWKRKVREQERQYLAAEETLKKLGTRP